MKRDLYIDCDGVILNTIVVAFMDMKNKGVDVSDDDKITEYFKNIDWLYLINTGGVIDNNIEKIQILKNSSEFSSVIIETHRCSYEEGVAKEEFFKNNLDNVQIITVPKKIKKHHAVNARDHFLIDDAKEKVMDWLLDGGIGILYNQNVDHLIYPYEVSSDQPYFITNNLLDLLLINEYYKEKVNTHEKVLSKSIMKKQ